MARKFYASVIVPVYNEEQRIGAFLKELKSAAKTSWEIIFVDDGSSDKSREMIKKSGIPNLKIISYRNNKGKGFAVKKGVDASSGKYIIFIDADGSINPSQINDMLARLKRNDFVVGNRTLEGSQVEQPLFRSFFGVCFNIYSNLLFGLSLRDKLCGFKGFKADTAKMLFNGLKSNRWIFDIEVFFKAKKKGVHPYEMPIKWEYRDKSKMKPYDPLKIALELIDLRLGLL